MGKGKILFMDDEEMLRRVAGAMLKRLGYEVRLANDGEEAIQLYQTAKKSMQPFDAVILDLTTPGGLGGKDAIKRLLEIDPTAKAAVSSGFSNDPVLANYKDYGFCGLLPKPFQQQDLSETLNALLGEGKTPKEKRG